MTIIGFRIWTITFGVAPLEVADSHFLSVKNILTDLGLPINSEKLETPNHSVTCLGIQINARNGSISIPDEKLVIGAIKLTRNQLQRLTGKLLYIHRCVKLCRIFLNRILQVLRNTPIRGHRPLPPSFLKRFRMV